jgi:hypothetical protein
MIQDNNKLKKIIDRVIKTYYGDKVQVFKSEFDDYDGNLFEYELYYKVIPDCKISDPIYMKHYKICDVTIDIVKFLIDGEKHYHRDDVPESEWEFFEETSLKFLSDNFQGVNFYPEITSSNLND